MLAGDAEKVFDLLSNRSITDELNVGEEFGSNILPEQNKKGIVALMNNKQFIPASKKDNYQQFQKEGVDFWAVGTEFIIS